jgi:hypothetical protein
METAHHAATPHHSKWRERVVIVILRKHGNRTNAENDDKHYQQPAFCRHIVYS